MAALIDPCAVEKKARDMPQLGQLRPVMDLNKQVGKGKSFRGTK
jgi:hypothetical protein